ncbi:MAG: hypothetical protein WED09_05480 [Homoserinimonas sp.]
MSAKRITGRAPIALCSLTVALVLAIATPAVAADGDSERGYPEVTAEWSAPNWYSSIPAFNDYPRYPPAPTSDPSLERDGIHVIFSHPGGGGPGSGTGDLSLRFAASDDTDSGQVDFSLLPVLAEGMGTEFIEATVLPYRPRHSLIGVSTETALPDVSFEGSTLVVTRPTCGVASLHTYESKFQVALLATNGFKYLADAHVSFYGKAKSKCAEDAKPEEPSPTTKPEDEKPAVSDSPRIEEEAERPKPDDSNPSEEWNLLPVFVALSLIGGAFITAAVIRRKHNTSTSARFTADGNLSENTLVGDHGTPLPVPDIRTEEVVDG